LRSDICGALPSRRHAGQVILTLREVDASVTRLGMRRYLRIVVGLGFWAAVVSGALAEQGKLPVKDLNTPREFPKIESRAEWEARAKDIHDQILVSAGLWPMPKKTPLNAKIFDKVEHGDFSVEKVYFQSYPGFYVAGSLYRPLGKGPGPFPAVLNTHGHSEHGRLEDSTNSSTVARCVNFARQGMVAFAYDMVGYNDTHFPESPKDAPFYGTHRNFATNDPTDQLWSVTLMGLQTWDSIRAVDFVLSLPDIDKKRIAVTGESGGGTQTYLLGAVDSRLAAQAPVVMVSHTMQGGCVCENMPGLRVDYSNVEIAAAACPRPQIMVAASGDWTKTMITMEGPSVAHIYDLFHEKDKLRYVRFDAPHNYNQTSREAVYRWFDHWLLHKADKPVEETPYEKLPDSELRVFPEGKLPPDAVSQEQLIKNLIAGHQAQLQEMQPKDAASLKKYKKVMVTAWKHTLQLAWPKPAVHSDLKLTMMKPDYVGTEIALGIEGEEVGVGIRRFVPLAGAPKTRVVLVHFEGLKLYINNIDEPIGLARQLLDSGFEVVVVERLPKVDTSNQLSPFFTTYNRTQLQENVRNLVAVCQAAATFEGKKARVVLCGSGRAGLWSMLAAPAADAVVADCDQLDVAKDQNLLAPDLFCPGIRNVGGFAGAALLAAPHPLLLHNVGHGILVEALRAAYRTPKKPETLVTESAQLGNDAVAGWIARECN
jgi:hypothetical protein